MRRILLLILLPVMLLLNACSPSLPEEVEAAYDELPDKLDYNEHVKPILSDKCFACHGPDQAKQKAGLRLDIAEMAFASLKEHPEKVAIKPGSLKSSEFFHRMMSSDPEYVMPTPASHLSLTAKEKAVLIKWIEDGATYKPHWAFVKPEKPEVPENDQEGWAKNPIDAFILSKLEQEKLKPSKQADKSLLLRRLSLDLTGLPPTILEIDAFLHDKSPNAYEKQVDRLLASPHYGEKMAVDWLDLARFADTHGYSTDAFRDMSPYRDWVISAFNSNQRYDKFIHWQLAGDLMPKPTRDMIVATAFNRNHQQNGEGGVVEEEFQTEYVVDRTNTFGDAMLGLSIGCAKCHDHKYDPITQKNYYELFSFFNNVKEAGQISHNPNDIPTPTLMLPTAQEQQVIAFIQKQVTDKETKWAAAKDAASKDFDKWLVTGKYRTLKAGKIPGAGLQAYYTFDQGNLKNSVDPKQVGVMNRDFTTPAGEPVLEARGMGKSVSLDGDVFINLNPIGAFRRSQPFTIGMWVVIPKNLKEGVIFHKATAERLYNFKGYHLYLKDNKLELSMAHTAPSNAITKISNAPVPRDQWIHLVATYDGSSKARGFKLYLDGNEMPMQTTMDQLTKDMLSGVGLQIGAWGRGWGLKGGKVDDVVVYDRELTPFEASIVAGKSSWNPISDKAPTALSPSEKETLRRYYLAAADPGALHALKELTTVRTTLADTMEKVREVMVMQEMSKRKKAHILLRGNYDAPGPEVFPNTPESVLAFPKNFPKNRYGLALWLTDQNNPLTSRVAVNRFWQNFFGTGLVKTTEDFGNQGEMPSHPQLLDWLAVTFRESGWDVKKLCKLIVMSAAYQQDSRATRESREKDPENRLLAHGPANRMTAEMIRDNALMAGGLINTKIGGRSIKPYQPDGLWEINSKTYKQDSGDVVYRRSLYIIAKRSVPNPTLATFDATSRSFCIVRRQKTNTPLQALVTLNDPTFTEACKAMGEQITKTNDNRLGIVNAYRKLTGRTPTDREIDLLVKLKALQEKKFTAHPEKTKGWLQQGQYVVDPTLNPATVAANSVVASTILNSDATLTKR
jgi:hypothetical protein